MTSAHKERTNEIYDSEKRIKKFETVEWASSFYASGKIIINLNKNDIDNKDLSLVFKKKAVFYTWLSSFLETTVQNIKPLK